VEPLLFGTGKLSLNDPDENDETTNPFAENNTPTGINDNDNDDDDELIAGPTAGSSKRRSSSLSKSGKTKTKDYGSTDTSRSSFWTIPTDVTSPVPTHKTAETDFDTGSVRIRAFPDPDERQDEESADEVFADNSAIHGGPDPPKQNCCVKIFSTVTVFALVTNLTMIVSQVLPLILYSLREFEPSFLALKIYLSIFSIILIVVEVDNDNVPFFRDAVFLKTYTTRGFFYTFLGLICFDVSHSERNNQMVEDAESMIPDFDDSWFALIDLVAAWMLISLGILYFLMGIFCLQGVRNRWVQEERQKWKNYREAVKAWKNEQRV